MQLVAHLRRGNPKIGRRDEQYGRSDALGGASRMRFLEQLNIEPGLLLAAGIALLAFIMLRKSMRHYRRVRAQQPLEVSIDRSKSPTPLLDSPNDILRWQVEMHDTARDLKAELDSKISALQTLLLLAEQERQRLEEVLERSEVRPQNDAAHNTNAIDVRTNAAAGGPIMPGNEQQRSEIYSLSDHGATPFEIAEQLAVPVGEVEFVLGMRGR